MNQYGPQRRKLVKSFGVEELTARLLRQLEEATRKVVPDYVAQDTCRCFVGRQIAAFPRSDKAKLPL